MNDPQSTLKAHCQRRLDHQATAHRSGHQNVKCRRYLLYRAGRSPIEIAIMIDAGSKLQIWCEADRIQPSELVGLRAVRRPGSETYSTRNSRGDLVYGRHSALKAFDRLHRGDVLRFVPETIGEVDRILDAIAGARPMTANHDLESAVGR